MPIIDTCDDIFLKKYLRDLRIINLAVSNASKKGLFSILLIFAHSSCVKINGK